MLWKLLFVGVVVFTTIYHSSGILVCAPPYKLYEPGAMCIIKIGAAMDHATAKAACSVTHAFIVNIYDNEKNTFVMSFLDDPSDKFWVGIQDYDGLVAPPGVFTYANGSTLGPFTPWKVPPGNGDKCVQSGANGDTFEAEFSVVPCTDTYSVICEAPADDVIANCDDGWIVAPDSLSCDKAIFRKKTWEQAKAHCEGIGATLTMNMTTREQRKAQTKNLLKRGRSQRFWIGVKHYSGNNTFQYVAGEDVESAPKLKDSAFANEDCIIIKRGSWKKYRCSNRAYFICSKIPTYELA